MQVVLIDEKLQRQLLGHGDMLGAHPKGQNVASIAGLLVAATGRDIQPHVGLQVVAFHAGTSGVQVAEGELGFAVSQARGGFIPPDGFCGVARRTEALVKAMAQLILGFSVIVFSFGQQGSQAQNAESVGLQEHHAKTTSQAGHPGPKRG